MSVDRDGWNAVLAALLLAAPAFAQGVKLSGTLPAGETVHAFEESPDGSWIVFETTSTSGGALYAVPNLGQRAPRLLSRASDGAPFRFAIAPGGRWIVFETFRYTSGTSSSTNLFAVPLDGSRAPVRLNAPLATPSSHVEEFALSPDASTVAYRAQQDSTSFELYVVPIDASRPPQKLSGPLIVPRQVRAGPFVTADGTRVLYLADQDTYAATELFSAPIDGSQPAVKLNVPFSQGTAYNVVLSPDGKRVLFRVVHGSNNLYSAPTDGSQPAVRLTRSPVSQTLVGTFAVSPDSTHAVFTAAPSGSIRYELYSVPLDGSSAPKLLTPPSLTYVAELEITPDSARVVFLDLSTNPLGLYVVPLDGSTPPVRLNDALRGGLRLGPFAIGGERVVYIADQEAVGLDQLYSAPLDGSQPAIRLNEPLSAGQLRDVFDFELAPDGRSVLYRANQESPTSLELFFVPLDGSSAPVRVNGTLVLHGNVGEVKKPGTLGKPVLPGDFYDFGKAGQVLYEADQDVDELYELYTSFTTRPVRGAR